MLMAWDFDFQRDGRSSSTRTSQALINEVTYPVMMSDEIDSRSRKKDPALSRLFVQKPRDQPVSLGGEEPRAAVVANSGSATDTRSGLVANINVEKGYGFVHPDGCGDNMFFHFKSMVECDISDLAVGSPVSFSVVATDRGPNAVAVRLKP